MGSRHWRSSYLQNTLAGKGNVDGVERLAFFRQSVLLLPGFTNTTAIPLQIGLAFSPGGDFIGVDQVVQMGFEIVHVLDLEEKECLIVPWQPGPFFSLAWLPYMLWTASLLTRYCLGCWNGQLRYAFCLECEWLPRW